MPFIVLYLDVPGGAETAKRFTEKIATDLVLIASIKAGSPSRKILWKMMSVLRTT